MDFFTIILSKYSTTVIMLDPSQFIEDFIETLYHEKEDKNKDFLSKKALLI